MDSETRVQRGTIVKEGYNVDRIDVVAGLGMAKSIGWADPEAQMVLEYALMRWKRGEEEEAEKMVISYYPNDLTAWRMVLAAARAGGEEQTNG